MGTDGGARFSTKEPKTLWVFERGQEQCWRRYDLGHQTAFSDDHGRHALKNPAFRIASLQMWAAYAVPSDAEALGERASAACEIEEAVASHQLFAAALESHRAKTVVPLD